MKHPISLPACPNPKVPAPTAEFFHCIPLQTRFMDIDMLGHINNSVYMSFMDLGKASYFAEVTGNPVEKGTLSVVIVNINSDFFSPGYLNEPLAVATAVTKVSERSLRMEQRVFNSATGDVKCVARTVLAGFDPMAAKGIPLPADFVAALEAFEGHSLR